MSKYFFLKIFTIFLLIFHSQTKIYPEEYKQWDLIIPENDEIGVYQYNLIDAKVLTREKITLYLKKLGINLDIDLSCSAKINFEAWNTLTDIQQFTDYKEIHNHSIYSDTTNVLTYNFPVPRIETNYYEVTHRAWIFNKDGANIDCKIYFNNDDDVDKTLNLPLNGGYAFLKLILTKVGNNNQIECTDCNGNKILTFDENYSISKINFKFDGKTYSPAISLHWTYYKIINSTNPDDNPNFTLKGKNICSYSNPCLKGYACSRGICEKCHPSCFDCINGGLSTDCKSQCSPISKSMLPDRGSCPLGYVDLSQFEDFTVVGIIPPLRNRRLTTSFWIYITNFPDEDADAVISVSYDPLYKFTFKFRKTFFIINFYEQDSAEFNVKDTWYYVKGGKSITHGNPFLYVKYFDHSSFKTDPESPPSFYGSDNGKGYYQETTDFASLSVYGFHNLVNSQNGFKFYIKELILFREYLPDPYDNKYFSYEKIFSSTFELPEVMFIIPFDELIKNDDKYDVNCYSYAGSIIKSTITLTPLYDSSTYSLYPPKNFRPLNLLGKNEKYLSPDLIEIGQVVKDENTLIAAYDQVSLSCIDKFFLTYDFVGSYDDETAYRGSCNKDCDKYHSMIHGLSTNKGFCNRLCGNGAGDPICLNNNQDLLNIKSGFKCKTGYYENYHTCESYSTETSRVFGYNSHQSPANIVLDVINYNLKSYIIDFWMKPEKLGNIDYGIYLFYTNQFQIYYKDQGIFYSVENRRKTPLLLTHDWSHYAIEVYYDPKQPYNKKSTIYLQKNYLSIYEDAIEYSENPLPLEYIYFCNSRRTTCNNIDISWNYALYKNLRLFNGNIAQRHILFRYDEYYSDYLYLLSSIKFYYPLYGHYIANNLWKQYKNQGSELNTNTPTNDWYYPQYSIVSTSFETCSPTCEGCFKEGGDFECNSCNNNEHLFRDEISPKSIECKTNNKNYVLRLPTNSNFKIDPLEDIKTPGVTVTFFIKIYGFAIDGKVDVIYLGDNLKISYNSDLDSDYFGLNLITFKGDNEIVVSNYYHFRRFFGVWTFISVSVAYDKEYESFFPPMVRFEINDKKIPIIGPLENLLIGKIYFPDYLFALVRSLTVYKTYLIGTNSFEMNKNERKFSVNNINSYIRKPVIDKEIFSYFDVVTSEDKCLFETFGIQATDKDNSDIIVPKYDCVIDELEEVYSDGLLGSNGYYAFNSDSHPYPKKKYNNTCAAKDKYSCSCNYQNNNMQIFLGNVSTHYCKNLSFINFAKAEDTIIDDLQGGGLEYTLHFWIFALSYVDKVFQGIKVDWEHFVSIEVGLDSLGRYYYFCSINGRIQPERPDFKMNEWNFLHCSVSYPYSKYTIASENKREEHSFSYDDEPTITTTRLIIRDLNTVKDWGVLFYKHIRIWDGYLDSASFLSRINITSNYYFTDGLIQQWNTYLYDENHIMKSTRGDKDIEIKYSTDKIGTNIVNEQIYLDNINEPRLCNESGQYYDRKTKSCINFEDVSNLRSTITLRSIDISYSHNYGMAFWILLEDHKNIKEPIDFIWKYHMRISLQYVGSVFKAYCFPQNYEPYSNVLDDNDISLDDKTTQVLNSATNEYTDNLSGKWYWFQCSLSFNNKYFYLNENKQTLLTETLYKEGNTEFKTDVPLGRFFNDRDNSLSDLKLVLNKNTGKKIYMRCFYLFKDHLPYNYDFKYMDMSTIGSYEFPPLTLAINFASFNFTGDAPNYSTEFDLYYRKYTSYDNKVRVQIERLKFRDNKFELAKNFHFQPLCNPITKEKYNAETELCEEISVCDYTELNAVYCMEEKTPLICKKNHYINIDQSSGAVTCENSCIDSNYFRTPGSNETTGICGTECLSNIILKTCPNSASSILTYQSDFECNNGFNRIGYQCIPEPTNSLPNKGALFYSGMNYPYNIVYDFSKTTISNNIGTDYVLEFWFMIDNTIKTSCINKCHYFFSKPHQIYMQKDTNGDFIYYYQFGSKSHEVISGLHTYEWNKILIFVEKEEFIIKFYANFDKSNPIIIETNDLVDDKDYKLQNIAFCSKKRVSSSTPKYIECDYSIDEWASAYYNNIRIWNSKISTIDTIQSFVNGIYSEYPQSLLIFYPLTIKYMDNNQLTNVVTNPYIQSDANIIMDTSKTKAFYNKDNIILYNYSTKFDWGILHKKQFVSSMDEEHKIDPNDANNKCNDHCLRCYDTDNIKECYECEEGYVLQYKECKDARKLYFLKTPSGTSGASIIFKTKNKDGKDFLELNSFTLVFWMKFFGIKVATTTENNKILSIDANTYLAYQRSTNNLIMLENSQIMFSDSKFIDYFGIWIPISIANYISGANTVVYPNMFTLSVNKRDIPFYKDPNTNKIYSIPESGIKITELSLGYDIIALFAEISIYSKFIQGGYGRIRSLQNLKDQFFYKSLTGTKPNDCLVVNDDLSSDISLICAPDYSVNFIDTYYCQDDTKYFDPYDETNDEKIDSEKCVDCNEVCSTLCFGDKNEECTCDMTEGIYWLRRNNDRQTYCENIYYLDFSNIEDYTLNNVPITKTQEYTIEFWVYIHSYVTKDNFKELYLEWNYHNKITLFYEDNSLKVNCQPIWRSHDFSTLIYSDIRTDSMNFYQWEYVRCGTDLKNRKYFTNTNIEYDLKAKKDTFFDFDTIDSDNTPPTLKYFKIYKSENFLYNFGFVFIKEIKLWQQYNIDYLDTKTIYFDMTKITKEELKKNFPGLLLYYQNDFNLTESGQSVIIEQMTGDTKYLSRKPTYIGYNIIDDNLGSPQKFQTIISCPYGEVLFEDSFTKTPYCDCPEGFNRNDASGECVPYGGEIDALCEVYSNSNKQCLQCKENNPFLNRFDEFPEDCYNVCPPTLYGDPLINQCRKCHPTCYECTNEFYNNCLSCEGVLYFNFKDNTCIPNCQAADLTRSLTKPNICVFFDAGAELVYYSEDIPININTFLYIEAKVVQPTSSEYETYWLFDVEKTNEINKELGLNDDIKKEGEHPFTGDRSKLNITLDNTFFKTEHKYVFGLKIYAENKGLEVPVYVYWTLTMNSPPFGGRVTTMPSIGLYNTTTFVIRCIDYQDENTPTEDLEYDFYYIEQNTNSKIKLSKDFSKVNEVYSNFTVRFYQLEYSNISIYCVVKDKWGATSQNESVITIVNDKHSEMYNLKKIVSSFYLEEILNDTQLLARAELLMSLGVNPYNDRKPSSFYTTYENSLTGDKIIKTEPQCVNGYCNDNGNCEVIDTAVTCKCNPTHLGKQCFIDKNGYADLAYWYRKMYERIMNQLNNSDSNPPLNDLLFNATYKLFFAAQNFFQNETFFEYDMKDFKNYLKTENNYITQNLNNYNKIFDFDVFYFNYFYAIEAQTKLTTKLNEGYQFRNKTLKEEEVLQYKNYFEKFFKMIEEDTSFMINNYKSDYNYSCQYFNYYLVKIDENFDDEGFFESLKTVLVSYKTSVLFMNCLKHYHSSFNYYLNYIEYLVNPMSFDSTFYPNTTSPYFSLKIYNENGEEVNLTECPSDSLIKINMTFNAYDWLNYINEQKWLFLPENYKLENDPVFRDPILIRKDGSISDDTVEERIKTYYRYYNIVGLVYTPNQVNLYEYTSILFKNISDAFYLLFETNHLSGFSSMLIPNPMKFIIDGRFFYLPRYMVLLFIDNHLYNPVFYLNAALFISFVIICIVYKIKDFPYFDNLERLDFLNKEVFKNNFGYNQIDPGKNDENIYNIINRIKRNSGLNNKAISGMFDQYEFEDIKEDEDENKSDKSENIKNNINNINTRTRRKLMIIDDNYNNKKKVKNDNNSDKQTELKTNKKRKKSISNKENTKSNKNNPPKRNKNTIDKMITNGEDLSENSDDVSPKNRKKNTPRNIGGYGEDGEEDFDENKLEKVLSSEKSSNNQRIVGFYQINQNYDLGTINSKQSLNSNKYSQFSKQSKQSKKSYFADKDNTRPNQYISIQKFHNKTYKLNIDRNIMDYEKEKKIALDEYTRLNNTPFEFFKYNLKTRHILLAAFNNLTLYHNRWKKLILLLTQFFIDELCLSIILTSDENILLNNITKMIIASLLSMLASNLLIHLIIPFFVVSFYNRRKMFRCAEKGEELLVLKFWSRLSKKISIKNIFAFIFIAIFWILNFYVTLGFTAVWKVQRLSFIVCFAITIIIDLVIGEVLIEGICTFFFIIRKKYNLVRNLGELINRYRNYRTLYP